MNMFKIAIVGAGLSLVLASASQAYTPYANGSGAATYSNDRGHVYQAPPSVARPQGNGTISWQ